MYACQFMTSKLFHFLCPFEFGKCGKEEKNYKNMNISRMKRPFKMK